MFYSLKSFELRGVFAIISLISGKKGKLYLRFIVAAAIIAAAIYSYAAIAANPAATPAIVNTSISVARASEVIK